MTNRWYFVAVVLADDSEITFVNKGATSRTAAVGGAWRRFPTARRVDAWLLPAAWPRRRTA